MRSMRLKCQSDAIVSGPNRPVNIMRMEISLEPTDSPGVMPVDSPTVPKAETISNRMSRSDSVGSSMAMAAPDTVIMDSASRAMTAALRKVSLGMA